MRQNIPGRLLRDAPTHLLSPFEAQIPSGRPIEFEIRWDVSFIVRLCLSKDFNVSFSLVENFEIVEVPA